jgi:hypothetical protein
MLSFDSPTRKQPASRRLLDTLRSRTKVPLAILTFAMLIAADGAQRHAFDAPWGSAHAYSRLGPRVQVQPDDVVKDGVVIGRDPDPFIRGEMLRHYGVGGP